MANPNSTYHKVLAKVNFPMAASNPAPVVVLVGTVHRDPNGYAKLLRLLEQERPSTITVEISPYSRAFRAKQAAALRAGLRENLQKIGRERGQSLREMISRSAILEIFLALREPYEWRAAKAYADRRGIPLMDIDVSGYAEEKLSHLRELISSENLRALLHLPSANLLRQVEDQYARAQFLFAHPPSAWLASEEVWQRDAHMAEKIRAFTRRKGERKTVHIGGWEHLVESPDGKSLFGFLKDLQPKRIILASMANGPFRQDRSPLKDDSELFWERVVGSRIMGKEG